MPQRCFFVFWGVLTRLDWTLVQITDNYPALSKVDLDLREGLRLMVNVLMANGLFFV